MALLCFAAVATAVSTAFKNVYLRTSNLAERMNEEIRRRERVIRIFMMEFWQWMSERASVVPVQNKVVAIHQ